MQSVTLRFSHDQKWLESCKNASKSIVFQVYSTLMENTKPESEKGEYLIYPFHAANNYYEFLITVSNVNLTT